MGFHRIVNAVVHRRAVVAAVFLSVIGLASACLPASPPGTSHSPSGHVDSVLATNCDRGRGYEPCILVLGWASDWDTTAPIQVFVLAGGAWYGPFVANVSRPDVDQAFGRGANYGFEATVFLPVAPVSGASVCVSAINVGPGENTLLGCPEVVWIQ